MNLFQQNYGVEENSQTDSFHTSRRMFAIVDGKLIIAEPKLPYSHATWFKQEGWINEQDDHAMAEITRGYVDKAGNVYFYVGYDFEVTAKAEAEMLKHLSELQQQLRLSRQAELFGGAVKQEGGAAWPARKSYGTISKYS